MFILFFFIPSKCSHLYDSMREMPLSYGLVRTLGLINPELCEYTIYLVVDIYQ